MANEAFFTQNGDTFTPWRVSAGPWDPNSLHGRVVIGLLGHEIQRRHGDDSFTPARLTVDMYRLPGFEPVEVATRMVRDGKRIKVVDAEFFSGGVSMARATCQLLKRTQNPEGTIWSPPNWDAPPPEAIELPENLRQALGGMWEIRPIEGQMGTVGRRRTWMREVRELIAGVPLTPFGRVALAADFASPFANAGTNGLAYINSDVTLYLHRLPVDEWIGFEVVNHQATDGVAIGECFAYDRNGAIGSSSVTALAQRLMKLG
jgi:acyl-CoA thioesterase